MIRLRLLARITAPTFGVCGRWLRARNSQARSRQRFFHGLLASQSRVATHTLTARQPEACLHDGTSSAGRPRTRAGAGRAARADRCHPVAVGCAQIVDRTPGRRPWHVAISRQLNAATTSARHTAVVRACTICTIGAGRAKEVRAIDAHLFEKKKKAKRKNSADRRKRAAGRGCAGGGRCRHRACAWHKMADQASWARGASHIVG